MLILISKTEADVVERDTRTGPGQNRDDWVKLLKIHGLKKGPMFVESGAAEYDYFIWNDFKGPVAVNGVSIASDMVAGPLPDFSIIDIDGFFVLWWSSLWGLTYTPVPKQDVGAVPSIEAIVNSDLVVDSGS